MKNSFKFYALIWVIMLAAFNLVVFLVRPLIPGNVVNYDAHFWIAWAFIIAAFLGNFVCAFFAFKAENFQKMFYNLPLITVSRAALIAILIVGCVLMIIPGFPAWITAIICILMLAFNAIAVIKALWAADAVGKIDDKVKTQTAFIKNLTIDADSILARAKSDPVKAECKKVYEAIRYSDPMSNDALSEIEANISAKMKEMVNAVEADDAEKAKEIADELVILAGDRNKKCKGLK